MTYFIILSVLLIGVFVLDFYLSVQPTSPKQPDDNDEPELPFTD